jgi:hypothetical protein
MRPYLKINWSEKGWGTASVVEAMGSNSSIAKNK